MLKPKTILLLSGEMGAGKTTFTRSLLESFGIFGGQSPTFALHHRYVLPKFNIEHLDLFRMQSPLELDGVGFWDFLAEESALIIIEWPERMDTASLPLDWEILGLEIEINTDNSRDFKFFKWSH